MSTYSQRLEIIILNLKVISKLHPNQYLLFKNKIVAIRMYYRIFTPVIRSISRESRNDIIDGLNLLVLDINKLIDDYVKSPELMNNKPSIYDEEFAKQTIMDLESLLSEIPNIYTSVDIGINAIFKTYEQDPVCYSRIESILTNIKRITRRLHGVISCMNKKYEQYDGDIKDIATYNKNKIILYNNKTEDPDLE